jgi:hypothetical protein
MGSIPTKRLIFNGNLLNGAALWSDFLISGKLISYRSGLCFVLEATYEKNVLSLPGIPSSDITPGLQQRI